LKTCLKCKFTFSTNSWECPSCGFTPIINNGIISHSPKFANNGDGGFKKASFSDLAKFENKSFWFKSRNKLITWALKRFNGKSNNFLEVGCGTGFVLKGISRAFPSIHLVGTEIHRKGLDYAIDRVPKGDFMQMDARQTPFYEEFDSIGAFDVLEHIKEDELVVRELYSALKPGGILLISVPQHPFLWSAADEYACHVRRYNNDNIVGIVKRSGFHILKNTSFVFILFPLMYLSRINNRNCKDYNPSNEFRINRFINYIFYLVLIFEIFCIKIGISFPLGGSRFIIAKK
jgi:SAM-dependent methyltransferase